MSHGDPQFIQVGNGETERSIAVRQLDGDGIGLLWLSGFKSDMSGTKAAELAAFAAHNGLPCTRFDYSGHGLSSGSFEAACVSDWLEEAACVFDRFCEGPTILVGSSMGGWIALLLALARRASGKLAGMVLIAPAADFTEELMWKQRFSDEIRDTIMREGRWEQPSDYAAEPYVITRKLIEDGRKHLILDRALETGCPVTILQGRLDPDVPWQHAMRLAEALPQDDVTVTLVPDGDHRLSRPQDIDLLLRSVGTMAL